MVIYKVIIKVKPLTIVSGFFVFPLNYNKQTLIQIKKI